MTSYERIKAMFLNALLADASYVNELPMPGNPIGLADYKPLHDRLGTPFAQYLAANFKVLNQYTTSNIFASGFSATVFQDLHSPNQIYFSARGTEPSPADFGTDFDLAANSGVGAKQVIDEINYFLRLTASTETDVQQIVVKDWSTLLSYLSPTINLALWETLPWTSLLEVRTEKGLVNASNPADPLLPLLDPTAASHGTGTDFALALSPARS